MLEKRVFTGGMVFDPEDRLIKPTQYRYALNCRPLSADGSGNGVPENVKGNTLVISSLPVGLNKTIGSYEDITTAKNYFFNYNNLGQHGIYEYDQFTNTITPVVVGSILNFSTSSLITHINTDSLGYIRWTDNYNEPRKINIQKAKTGGYGTITEQHLSAASYPPTSPPIVEVLTDNTVQKNNIRGNLFQFGYSYTYDDFSISKYSPVSIIAAPNSDEYLGNTIFLATSIINNRINVTVETGDATATKINIHLRASNSEDWYIVETLEKYDQHGNVLIPNNSTYQYAFYNDRALISENQAYARALYDYVPLLAQSQELIDGSRLVYANILEGYDTLKDTDVSITPVSIAALQNALSQASINILFSPTVSVVDFTTLIPPTFQYQAGDVVWLGSSILGGQVITYVVTPADIDVNPITTANNIALQVNTLILAAYPTTTTIITSGVMQVNHPTSSTFGVRYGTVYRLIEKFGSFKKGSWHNFGLVYYDEKNRSTTTTTNAQFSVFVPFTVPTTTFINTGIVNMDWAIRHLPPDFATHYQWVYTGSVNIEFCLDVALSANPVQNAQTNNTELKIEALSRYQIKYPDTILSYDFAEGDRCVIMYEQPNTPESKMVDVRVLNYDSSTFTLTVENISNAGISPVSGGMIQIYRPRETSQQQIYWEFGQRFAVGTDPASGLKFHAGETQNQDPLNPTGTPATGTLTRGDTWMRLRQYQYGANTSDVANYIVEDFNYSDFYASADWDRGRPNRVDSNFRQTRREATARNSGQLIPDTSINGLSSFLDVDFADYDSKYGSIQKIYSQDRKLLLFQELRCGFVMMQARMVGNENQAIVAYTDLVLNPITYYQGNWGIATNPESFAVYGGAKYFADINHGCILRLSNDGLSPISDYEFSNFFAESFKALKQYGQRVNIYGVFDRQYDEYVLAVENPVTGESPFPIPAGYTISFHEPTNQWHTFYSYQPENFTTAQTDIISFKNGNLYTHNTNSTYNNFYGIQYESELWMVFNQNPDMVKIAQSVWVSGLTLWWMYEATMQNGQKTSLIPTDFEEKEGVYYAAVLFDENTPNVANPIIEGDPMRSHSMLCKFKNADTSFSKVFAISLMWAISERTSK